VAANFDSQQLAARLVGGLRSAAPNSFVLAVLVLGVIAVATGLLPARRATQLDPLVALRDE